MKLLPLFLIGCFEDLTKNDLNEDLDGDGYTAFEGDCDDNDPNLLGTEVDADCDGVLKDDDCDDNDPLYRAQANDQDCDTIITERDCDDNDPTSTVVAEDADCDGARTADDCDDADVSVGAWSLDADCDGHQTADDCDDSDELKPNYDADCDGVSTATDCDDNDTTLGLQVNDQDCDGYLIDDDCDDTDPDMVSPSLDADCDGLLATEDCNDNDDTMPNLDQDCDGSLTANDCDDNDVTMGPIVNDQDCDGILAVDDCDDLDPAFVAQADDQDCDGFLTDDDCDDDNPHAYPGAAPNEPDQTACYIDMDGDGYGDPAYNTGTEVSCFVLEMIDSYGDSWNGNEIEIFENSISVGTYTNDDSQGSSHEETYCFDPATVSLDFMFHTGSYLSEVSFNLYYDDGGSGIVVGAGQGTSNHFVFEGTSYADGDIFYSVNLPVYLEPTGSDCDDSDPNIHPGIDGDSDGYSICHDCNDSNGSINAGMTEIWYDGTDSNCDGLSDYDQDRDGFYVDTFGGTDCNDTNPNIHPDITETYYNGVDENCDGQNDYDQDGDGYTSDYYGGTDCFDSSIYLTPLANEADPNACYYDYDRDGWGDTHPGNYTYFYSSWGLSPGTDCDDSNATINPATDNDGDGWGFCHDEDGMRDCDDSDPLTFPGAGYNEPDFDVNDLSTYTCVTDADGDGYGSNEEVETCFIINNTNNHIWSTSAGIRFYEDDYSIIASHNNYSHAMSLNPTGISTYCVSPDTSVVRLYFIIGSNSQNLSFSISQDIGGTETWLGSGYGYYPPGSVSNWFHYDGQNYHSSTSSTNAFLVDYPTYIWAGTDSNDLNPSAQ